MLGKPLFTVNAADFVRGMSTSDEVADGGFSPLSTQQQLTYTPGVVFQIASPVDKSTNLVGTMIASCEDPSGSASRLFVSANSSQDGRFFTADSVGTLTARGSADVTRKYIAGRTDIIGFQGEAYVTTATTLVRWQLPATINYTFLTFNDPFAPHPALVFEGYAYYGDGNELWRQTTAGVAPTIILTLANSSEVITALGIDPGSGKMLISTVSQYNVSDTINSVSKVLYYNGYSNKVDKTVVVDTMVEAFYPVGSTVYIGYGQNIGIWNGAGIQFLRKLAVSLDNNRLPYKHHFSNIDTTLYVIENGKILAYGSITQGAAPVFYYALEQSIVTTGYTNIANIGNNLLTTSFISTLGSADSFYTWDSSAIGTEGQSMYSNKYEFDRPYWIRRVRVVYKNSVANGSGTLLRLVLNDESGRITSIGVAGVISLLNSSGAAEYYHWVENVNVKVNMLQLLTAFNTDNPGIKRIVVYADPADQG